MRTPGGFSTSAVRYSAGSTALLFGLTSAPLLLADLLSKWLVFSRLEIHTSWALIPGCLNFAPSRNAGAVFGIGAGMQPVFITFSFLAAGAILWAVRAYGTGSRILTAGLGLLLGGALGNLWDRMAGGTVRDFIDFYIGRWHWYTFNVADVGICLGCGLIILHSLLTPGGEAKPSRS